MNIHLVSNSDFETFAPIKAFLNKEKANEFLKKLEYIKAKSHELGDESNKVYNVAENYDKYCETFVMFMKEDLTEEDFDLFINLRDNYKFDGDYFVIDEVELNEEK